jgi:CheY-like chemotaxis protein
MGTDARKKEILLVEDDPDVSDMMALYLESEGYHVAAAANGQEALNYLERSGRPALILLDLMMPVMNGWEFRERLRQTPGLAQIPVVLLSADSKVPEEAARLGVASYLRKPVEFERLLRVIERYC